MKYCFRSILLLVALACSFSCMKDAEGPMADEYLFEASDVKRMPAGGPGGGGNTNAGMLTAGEWNDLSHWDFWSGLMVGEQFKEHTANWGFFTNNRAAVKVTDHGAPVANVPVALLRDGKVVWQARTDNHGLANCWAGLEQKEDVADPATFSISVGGTAMEGPVRFSGWDQQAEVDVNKYEYASGKKSLPNADIAFIVDATGSMGDEIAFLKSDLKDIINKVCALKTTVQIRTAALFYRDEGDEYVTREKDFTHDFNVISDFIGAQDAGGGGDYPEAVHTALEDGLQKLSWDENAHSRIAFLILDAPAHNNAVVKQSLHDSIELYAKMGIRLIPVAASGIDKSAEFMSRFFAVVTGGTYIFLTDDSGIGGDHIEASVGEFEVEQLNGLMVRVITDCIE